MARPWEKITLNAHQQDGVIVMILCKEYEYLQRLWVPMSAIKYLFRDVFEWKKSIKLTRPQSIIIPCTAV